MAIALDAFFFVGCFLDSLRRRRPLGPVLFSKVAAGGATDSIIGGAGTGVGLTIGAGLGTLTGTMCGPSSWEIIGGTGGIAGRI